MLDYCEPHIFTYRNNVKTSSSTDVARLSATKAPACLFFFGHFQRAVCFLLLFTSFVFGGCFSPPHLSRVENEPYFLSKDNEVKKLYLVEILYSKSLLPAPAAGEILFVPKLPTSDADLSQFLTSSPDALIVDRSGDANSPGLTINRIFKDGSPGKSFWLVSLRPSIVLAEDAESIPSSPIIDNTVTLEQGLSALMPRVHLIRTNDLAALRRPVRALLIINGEVRHENPMTTIPLPDGTLLGDVLKTKR